MQLFIDQKRFAQKPKTQTDSSVVAGGSEGHRVENLS
jgi:hypothetical protein